MKTSLFKPQWVIMVVSILLLTPPLYANDATEASLTKEFNGQVTIGKNGTLKIEDKFGNIIITHWDKPEISYRMVVTAKGNDKNLAQRRLDGVSLVEKKSGNSLYLSSLKDIIESNKQNNNNSMPNVDYYITMPSSISLELNQEFGNITLPDQNNGKCEIRIRFGNLDAGSFSQALKLDAEFGNIKLKDVHEGKLTVNHCGKVILKNSDNVEINSSFSNIEINGEAKVAKIKNNHAGTSVNSSDKIMIDSSFGAIQIGKSNNAEIKSNHGSVTIDYLGPELVIKDLNFGKLKIREVSPMFKSITVKSQHSNIDINIPSSSSFKVNATGYKHGKCNVKGLNTTTSHINEDKDNYYYEINGANGGIIELKSDGFSNTTISKL